MLQGPSPWVPPEDGLTPSPRDPLFRPPLIEKCDAKCPDWPVAYVYVYGGDQRIVTHYHQLCWMCHAEVVGVSPGAYQCDRCDYKQGTWASPPFMPDYDPEFAAHSSAPG